MAGLVAGLASPAQAAPGRFHLLSPRLLRRLSAPTQDRAASVVRYGKKGTGSIVAVLPRSKGKGSKGRGRALVLTNHHVAGQGFVAGETVRLADGRKAKTIRLAVAVPALDYALVEVRLPRGRAPSPLKLGTRAMQGGEGLYAVSAFSNLGFDDPGAAIGGGRSALKKVAKAIRRGTRNHPTIAVGEVLGDGRPGRRPVIGRTLGTRTDLPNAPGMSGSPVFSAKTHELVGLHFAGNAKPGQWQASAAPASLIRRDLFKRLRRGQTDPASSDLLQQVIER